MTRKPRKDSKLHNLPPEQRARVDKWLFDKGLTYQQVAEGCLKMFGLNISKSSVGRYYERETIRRVSENRKPSNLEPGTLNFERATPASLEEGFQELLVRIARRALDLATYLELERDAEGARELLRLVRVLIAARRERTVGVLARAERDWVRRGCPRFDAK